jgi:hypothetical protein
MISGAGADRARGQPPVKSRAAAKSLILAVTDAYETWVQQIAPVKQGNGMRPDSVYGRPTTPGTRGLSRSGAILVVAGAVMLGVLLYVGRWLLFWADEWGFIVHGPDPTLDALLAPNLDTFVAVPVMVYDALLAVFGMRTYLPYLAVAWAAHFVSVAFLYRIVTRRSGILVGLSAAISLLFLGSGFEVLLHPFQIQYLFAIVGGLIALDQLDSITSVERRRKIAIAAVALVLGVASSGLGVIFTGLILLWGILRRHRPTLIAVLPAITLYAAWYFTWGQASSRLPGPGLGPLESLYAVSYGVGAAVSGLIGLPPYRFALLGLALAVAAVAAVAVAVWRGYRPDALALAAVAALMAEHVLQTYFRASFGVEHGARSGYVYPGVIFLWLAFAGVVGKRLEAERWRPRAVPVAVAMLLLLTVLGNMRQFFGAAVESRHLRATELAELRLIESLRDEAGLALDVLPDSVRLVPVTARQYFVAIDRFGRPILDWDWETEVDAAAVESARRILLPD